MLDVDTKRKINNTRDILVGKVPNPQSQVDLITVALIYKFMDDMDLDGLELSGKRTFFVDELEQFAFSRLFDTKLGNMERMDLYVRALEKLQIAKTIPELFRTIFKGAFLPFRDPQTLTLFLKEINGFTYDNSETLGNAFEYLLSIMGSQGDAGQFRTPRHIIDFIVDVIKPTKNDTILDPACGTAGFLISAYKHIINNDNLNPAELGKLTNNIAGYDISPDMRKLALVNLYLHKFENPKIYEYDTLTSEERWNDKFDVILANPPFMTPKGGIIPHSKFGVKANRAEVLFVDYIAEHLTINGRAGIIVPEGIIFQSSIAYKQLRKILVDGNYLYAVVSLPSGIFNPYSGVKTSILLFDKQIAKQRKDILFIKIENDGFDLGAQRRPINTNDLPEAIQIIDKWKSGKDISKHTIALSISKKAIAEDGDYNLTAGRYAQSKETEYCKFNLVSLKDVAKIDWGNTSLTKESYVEDGEFLGVSAAGCDGRMTHAEHNIGVSVLSAIGANCGKMFFPHEKFTAIKNTITFTPDIKKIDPKFLYFIMQNNSIPKRGGGQPFMSKGDVEKYKIPLPPLDIQKQIVAEIENKQSAINHAQEIIKNLDTERHYFGSLLDGIKYEMVELKDIADVISGQSPEGKYYNQVGDGMPFYQGRTEFKDRFIGAPKTWTTDITKTAIRGDILMSVRAPVGPVNICGLDKICIGRGIAAIRVKNKVEQEYLYSYLKSIENTISGNGGAVFDSINRNQIEKIKIPLPSPVDQNRIVEQINSEESIMIANKKLINIMQDKINTVIGKIYNSTN